MSAKPAKNSLQRIYNCSSFLLRTQVLIQPKTPSLLRKWLKSCIASTLAITMTFSGLPYCSAAVQNPSPSQSTLDSRAMQAADLIGVRKQVEEIVSFQKGRYDRQNVPLHLIDLRGRTYQSIMGGVCDVRVATNKIERELTYTYAQYRKEVSKIQEVDQMFNLMNFAQFSVLYSLEGLSRQKNQFNQSSILVAVSSGLGLLLPTMNIIYDKMARRKAAPPERFSMLVEGVAVTDLKMPDLVARFMNSKSPGASQTRKEQKIGRAHV